MKVFIIEDEYLGKERLVRLLQEVDPETEVLGHAESVRSSVQWLQHNPEPDLLFVDIELADGQSFEIFSQVEVQAPMIFTTSYDEYALQAFKVHSLDYLLKPIQREELKRALDKYRQLKARFERPASIDMENLVREIQKGGQEYRQRFLVKQGQRWLSIETHEIAWFMADGKICFLKTWDNRRFIVDYSLEELATMLDPALFFRANRSYIVHARAVKSIDPHLGGKLILQLTPLSDGASVVVSKEKATEFKVWMGK
ncbi:MAG: response regulator transcription factor [Bacteroidetes bacterium]|nr:MAG: response regulator transcription factor [Bacteroidota bacterium]